MNLTVHNVYFCFSEVGCTISLRDGTPCKEVPAHEPTLFVAQQPDMVCSDPAAVVKEIPNGLQLLHGQMMKEQAAGGLPAGYKRVEYLESTGTQYIVTYIDSNNIDIVELQASQSSVANGGLIFWQSTTTDAGFQIAYLKDKVRFDYGGYSASNPIAALTDGVNYISFSKETGNWKVNDTSGTAQKIKAFSLNSLQRWFLLSGYPYKGKCYSAALIKAGKKHLKFIPALDPTGAPCMYDLVSRKPFYNSGTGDFLYPTETATYSLRRVLPDWGKLTENGLRRLYHAPANYKGELIDYALENGYKPIVEPEQPEEGYWSPRWTETEDEIVLEWVETEPPMNEPLTNN